MWKLPLIETQTHTEVHSDLEIVFVLQDQPHQHLKNEYQVLLQKLEKTNSFQGKLESFSLTRFLPFSLANATLFVGLGKASELTQEKLRKLGAHVWNQLLLEKVKKVHIFTENLVKNSCLENIFAFAEGMILSAYQFDKYQTKKEEEKSWPTHLIFTQFQEELKSSIQEKFSKISALGEAIRVTRDWSNEPSNHGHPDYFAQEAKKLAQEYGIECKIFTEKEAHREKMNLFLGVAQGGARPPRLVILDYKPQALNSAKSIALVGKGITFDSGGISLKPSARMEEMKHDMSGAATVMGAILLAAKFKVPNRVIALMAFAENMPDGNAIQPGNVLISRNGCSVEVTNTDAEGRLILADALDYIQDYCPTLDAIVDVATLTGAVGIALGKHHCAILGNNQQLIEFICSTGKSQSEKIWQLPLNDEYFEDMKSDFADMKNAPNDHYGGTIRGAIFLKQFIRNHTPWAHLDIATTAYNLTHLPYYPKKGASGAYVRTLAQFVAQFKESVL